MKTLIIGGTRFLGAAIAEELLAKGHMVTVFHRGKTPGQLPCHVHHVLGDVNDRDKVQSLLAENAFDAVIDTILNAKTLEWLLPLLKQFTGQLVHCGSTGVYAPMAATPAREEDPTPCRPEYGGFEYKLEQDMALIRFHEETGFKTCSLRVSNVIGRWDMPLDIWGARNPAYCQRIADDDDIWIPNDGRALVQPVHIDDLAKGFRAAMECDIAAGQIYNLSSDRAITLTEYASMARDLLGSSSTFSFVPMNDIIATGRCNEGGIRFLCEHMSIDWSKAHDHLGYMPRVSIRNGLRESLAWMVETGLLKARVSD